MNHFTAPVEKMPRTLLSLNGVSFAYGEKFILEGLDWSLMQGDFECVIGRSGCGKSTLLQLLCGLVSPQKGDVVFRGNTLSNPVKEISYVFQKPNLLDWLNVIDNVLLPLKLRGELSTSERANAMQILDLLGISAHADKLTWQLSGGEQSRVAIARALVASPKVLLMDEPFASLDAITREELQVELRNLHDQLGLTTVFVTHDIQEAIYLGDRVRVVKDGHFVHTQDIDFPSLRLPSLKDESLFSNYSNSLRTSLGSPVYSSAACISAQGAMHV